MHVYKVQSTTDKEQCLLKGCYTSMLLLSLLTDRTEPLCEVILWQYFLGSDQMTIPGIEHKWALFFDLFAGIYDVNHINSVQLNIVRAHGRVLYLGWPGSSNLPV